MTGLPKSTLVLGGARSGKSRYAEGLIEAAGCGVYLATAQTLDDEMRARVAEHRSRRGGAWETLEEPLDLAGALAKAGRKPVLVDCLTLWLTNLMLADRDLAAAVSGLVDVLPSLDGPVVFVSNEVGLGIVPDNAMARAFRDAAGVMHQRLAAASERVVFVTAGLPMILKDAT